MFIIEGKLVSDDLREVRFACDLKKCKGICCVEGDAGAPLEEEEITLIEDHLEEIKKLMTARGIEVVGKMGAFDYDHDGSLVTPLISDRECAYVFFENGIARCAIEAAWMDGRIPFRKPVSCHLYPLRIHKNGEFEGINYHRWHICEPGRTNGKKQNIALCEFLREALERKYGKGWYERLVREMG